MKTVVKFIFAFAMIALSFQIINNNKSIWFGLDFHNIWLAPKLAKSCNHSFYTEECKAVYKNQITSLLNIKKEPESLFFKNQSFWQNLELTASPFLYFLLSPFSGDNYEANRRSFLIFSMLLFYLCLYFFARELNLPNPLFIGLIIPIVSAPVFNDLVLGNVNSLQLLFFALLYIFLFKKKNYLFAGLVFGVSVVFKPNFIYLPLILLSYLFFTKQFAKLFLFFGGAAAGSTTAVVVTLFSFSPDYWRDWYDFALVPLVKRKDLNLFWLNMSVTQYIYEYGKIGKRVITQSLHAIFTLFTLIYAYWLSLRKNAKDIEVSLFYLGSLSIVLLPSLLWFHYESLFLPLIMFFYRNRGYFKYSPVVLLFILLLQGINPWWNSFAKGSQILVNTPGYLLIFCIISIFIPKLEHKEYE